MKPNKHLAAVLLPVILLPLLLFTGLAAPAAMAQPAEGRAGPPVQRRDHGVNHKVQRGETLFSIAEKYYGKGRGYEWVRLQEYNAWVGDPNLLNIGELIYIPDPSFIPSGRSGGQTSRNLPLTTSLASWLPNMNGISLFGRSVQQVLLIVFAWFTVHFSIQGVFVWFAAHLAFVKDVNLKKAMRAAFQSESLAFLCVAMAALVGLMLLYVGTTSPGKPVTAEVLSTAEEYLGSPTGLLVCGLLLVALYGFLGIRFIPPAFGLQAGRGMAVVLLSILLPHLIGIYLVGHRIGLID